MKYLLALSITLLAFGCKKEKREAAAKKALERSEAGLGASPDCSMAGDSNLDSALAINRSLAATIDASSQECKAATAQLNHGGVAQLRNHIGSIRSEHLNRKDLVARVRNLQREIAVLKSKGDPALDEVIEQYQTELNTAKIELSNARSSRRLRERDRRDDTYRAMPQIIDEYNRAFQNCRGSEPKIVTSLVQSGVAVASSMGGLAGGAAFAASLLSELAMRIADTVPTLEDKMVNGLLEARAPYLAICSIEAVTQIFCKARREKEKMAIGRHQVASTQKCRCAGVTVGFRSHTGFREILSELKEMYPNHQAQIADGKDSPAPPPLTAEAFAVKQNERLHRNMNDIENYLNVVEKDARSSRSISAKQAIAKIRSVRKTLKDVKGKQTQTDVSEVAKLFSDPKYDLYNAMSTVSQLHQNMLETDIADKAKRREISSVDQEVLMRQLSGYSAQLSANAHAAAVAQGPPQNMKRIEQQVNHAYVTGLANVQRFSNFMQERVPITKLIDTVNQTVAGDDKYGRSAADGVISQLCGASLALYATPNQSLPPDLIKKCRGHSPSKNVPFSELARRPHSQRACLPFDLGVIGTR